jgi:hypothetical protein
MKRGNRGKKHFQLRSFGWLRVLIKKNILEADFPHDGFREVPSGAVR